MSKLVTIYGGSGFVGRYIARRMAKDGWRVRVAVRRPNEAIFVRPYGVPGQVEPILCNIRDDASVRAAMQGADAVVNCVGILAERGKNRFDATAQEEKADPLQQPDVEPWPRSSNTQDGAELRLQAHRKITENYWVAGIKIKLSVRHPKRTKGVLD